MAKAQSSSSSTPRQISKEQTRQRLIQSAHKLILEKGLAGLTMNQISRKAGIAQPSFYNHYHSLPELIVDVRKLMTERYLSPLQLYFVKAITDWKTQLSDTQNLELDREALRSLNKDYLSYNFDILLRDINIFKVVLADYHDQGSPLQNELGKLIDDINLAWCEFLSDLARENKLAIPQEHIRLYVDSLSALTHQLVLGCDQNRYTKEQAVLVLTQLSEALITEQPSITNLKIKN
jgi:TetR/AcrR family transcriptional regulator of autoinduction and epiphytic fitness